MGHNSVPALGDLVHEQAGTEGPLRGLATLSLHE